VPSVPGFLSLRRRKGYLGLISNFSEGAILKLKNHEALEKITDEKENGRSSFLDLLDLTSY
jgi:hypothetical protein